MRLFLFLLFPLMLTASCKKYEEDGSTFRAKKKLTKSWVYEAKVLSDGTVLTPEHTYIQTFKEDGTMLLTSDFDTAYTELNWQWEFLDGKMSYRNTLDNWGSYILCEIIKLTKSELWIRTQGFDNGVTYGEPDLEKYSAL